MSRNCNFLPGLKPPLGLLSFKPHPEAHFQRRLTCCLFKYLQSNLKPEYEIFNIFKDKTTLRVEFHKYEMPSHNNCAFESGVSYIGLGCVAIKVTLRKPSPREYIIEASATGYYMDASKAGKEEKLVMRIEAKDAEKEKELDGMRWDEALRVLRWGCKQCWEREVIERKEFVRPMVPVPFVRDDGEEDSSLDGETSSEGQSFNDGESCSDNHSEIVI